MSARTSFEDALEAWVASASGLAATWRDGRAPRPAGAFVELRLGPLHQVGQDWLEVKPGTPPDSDAVVTARGVRWTELRLEAFGGPSTGDTAPDEILELVMNKAKLPSYRAALNAGGVGIAAFGPLQTVDGMLGASKFEPRALLTVRLNLQRQVSEFASYIGEVDLQSTTLGLDFEVDS